MNDETKRICANCACFVIETDKNNPENKQGFCHLNPAIASQARVEVPRLDNHKNPVMKNGVPVMNNEVRIVYLYPPMQAELTCFSGWRPIGTLPGEKLSADLMGGVLSSMRKLYVDITAPQTPSEFVQEPECIHGQVVGLSCSTCPDGIAEWPKTE